MATVVGHCLKHRPNSYHNESFFFVINFNNCRYMEKNRTDPRCKSENTTERSTLLRPCYKNEQQNEQISEGRPKKRWLDAVQQDNNMLGITVAEAGRLAQDKQRWRRSIRSCCCAHLHHQSNDNDDNDDDDDDDDEQLLLLAMCRQQVYGQVSLKAQCNKMYDKNNN